MKNVIRCGCATIVVFSAIGCHSSLPPIDKQTDGIQPVHTSNQLTAPVPQFVTPLAGTLTITDEEASSNKAFRPFVPQPTGIRPSDELPRVPPLAELKRFRGPSSRVKPPIDGGWHLVTFATTETEMKLVDLILSAQKIPYFPLRVYLPKDLASPSGPDLAVLEIVVPQDRYRDAGAVLREAGPFRAGGN